MQSESQSTSMGFLLLEEVQFLEAKDDALFQWELVDVLDAQEEPDDDGERNSVRDEFGFLDSSISWSISSPDNGPIEGIHHRILHSDADVEDHSHRVVDHHHHDANRDRRDSHQFDEGDDGDEDDDGYDLDDELVPWNVCSKFGRQRMRKLGKRAFSKMQNSKRSPYLFVRPGCVRGKHGLGLKHNY